MAIENLNAEPSITDVVSGIVADVQKLASQQIALLRSEVSADWGKCKRALRPMIAGGAFALVGMILLGFSATLGLYWAVSPPAIDPSGLPLWACFGICSVVFLGIGGVLLAAGIRAFQSFNPLPNETVEAFETNLKALVH